MILYVARAGRRCLRLGALIAWLGSAAAQDAANDAFRGAIGGALSGVGFETAPSADAAGGGSRILVRGANYRSIFGGDADVDFALYAPEFARPVFIKALRAGDAVTEERMSFTVLNAMENVARTSTILIFGGDDWSDGAMGWVRAQAQATDGVDVMTLEEFIDWANATFR